MFVFSNIWRALFFCNAGFQFHPFALLPTIVTCIVGYLPIFNNFLSLISNLLVFWKLGVGALLFQYT